MKELASLHRWQRVMTLLRDYKDKVVKDAFKPNVEIKDSLAFREMGNHTENSNESAGKLK